MKHADWCPQTPWLRRPVWIDGKPVCYTCGRPNEQLEQLELTLSGSAAGAADPRRRQAAHGIVH